MADPSPPEPSGRLSEREFHAVYARVPRLTVEVVVRSPSGILLTQRTDGPCAGLWHLPGGTVRYAEPVTAAVERVAASEVGLVVTAGPLLGYIEYPSHVRQGLDSPVGLAFLCDLGTAADLGPGCRWCTAAPQPMHEEQVEFLVGHHLLVRAR